jgi:large subunit ribosomal protein L15
MQLHSITRPTSLKRAYRRVGRGQSSTRGKQSGRGGKGQTARAGNKRRPELRDIIKKLPKRRGYGKNRGRTVVGTRLDAVAIPLERLSALFESGAEITRKSFVEKGVISARRMPPVKIVGGGSLDKKLSLKGVAVSASARAAIEKAGGTIA